MQLAEQYRPSQWSDVIGLFDVRPRFAVDDPLDLRPPDAELSGDSGDALLSGKAANSNDVRFGQFCSMVFLPSTIKAKHFYCMPRIFSGRDVLKIDGAVISLVAVDMVDLLSRWAWANERLGNDAVNRRILSVTFNPKVDSGVYVACHERLEDSASLSCLSSSIAANATNGRYGVKSFVSDNWFPGFSLCKLTISHDTFLSLEGLLRLGLAGVVAPVQPVYFNATGLSLQAVESGEMLS
jgi:hypothetical protein